MGKLKVLASGKSPQAQSRARGKLFEQLMSQVLGYHGYSIDRIPNTNYAGMEIDIEGKANVTSIPLYAECKCYDTDITSPRFQEFFGKYMGLWLEDKRRQGLFIALPGLNSHAKGFYRERCEGKAEITVRLLEEPEVLETIFQTRAVTNPTNISAAVTPEMGTPGDWVLLYTEKGFFWVQYIVPPEGGVSSRIALFVDKGTLITDKSTIDYLIQLYPELRDFERVSVEGNMDRRVSEHQETSEEIVEVRGSSECFEYQFPAAPEYFVGRQPALSELDEYVDKVLNKDTSSRGVLFEANSGWGKSSTVLASVDRLKAKGHFVVAIDSRSASSSQFVLRAVDYSFRKFDNFDGVSTEQREATVVTGFEGAVEALVEIGKRLAEEGRVLLIFFDQFENVFFLPDVLKRLTDLLLKLCDVQTNVVLGFSWKTDLVGPTREFPYQLRDLIIGSSRRIALDRFSGVETTALLNKLGEELRQPLRKDLEFFISEFSQGYPWLLKKLCAHVKAQRQTGVLQADIASSLLNIEELFEEDLRGLSDEQENTLRRIAKSAPINFASLGEDFSPEIVQSLVNARLIVRIGDKYDVYWDIFRDYLNAGYVPIQDNYLLRIQVRSVFQAIKLVAEAGGSLDTATLLTRADLSAKSFYNIARDMRLVGIATVENGTVTLRDTLVEEPETKGFENLLRNHLRDKLQRNRLVLRFLDALEAHNSLSTKEAASLLRQWCPYISAAEQTWKTYARILAEWMDLADLIIFDNEKGSLSRYAPGTEVRKRDRLLPRRRGGMKVPSIQYTPIERTIIRIVEAVETGSSIDWTGMTNSTIAKAVGTLEDLGFVVRKRHAITVLPKAVEFVSLPERRAELFGEGAVKIRAFATFVEILNEYKHRGRTLAELGVELNRRLGVEWKESTAKTNAKIMLDWARHTGLAPGAFAEIRQGPKKGWRENDGLTSPLFALED